MWKLTLVSLFFFYVLFNEALSTPSKPQQQQQQQILNNCNSGASSTSPDYFLCKPEEHGAQCRTYTVVRANSYYSSLANLTLYLGLTPKDLNESTGLPATAQVLPAEQPLLIPIDCKCNTPSGLFEAALVRTTAKGDSFHAISESLEGLTTCKKVVDKNPSTKALPFQDLGVGVRVSVPVKCSCPTKVELSSGTRFLISYPVKAGDTLASLASYFKVSKEAIILANNKRLALKDYYKLPGTQPLVVYSSVLIPVNQKPVLGSPKVGVTSVRPLPNNNLKKKKKKKKKKKNVMIAAVGVAVGATAAIAIASAYLTLQQKKMTENEAQKTRKNSIETSNKLRKEEPQPFNLSIRTASEKKLSFEGSQSTIDDATPHKKTLETYTMEEIKRATEDFHSHNLVEGPVYHGRIRGKDVAVKCTPTESFPKVDFTLFQDSFHDHPNILRLYGACFCEAAPQSFLVFEYAKNGSLKDWIHGGLAVKSQFIASCSCFLNWSQRLRICLDVAMALQYMHHVMNPPYVHRNVKSRNVFIDEAFRGKIGNFGMARCTEEEEGSLRPHLQFSEKWNSWNKAYMAPETRKRGGVTTGVDIYAYGVVLLEVLSGQKPMTYVEDKAVLLAEKVKGVIGTESRRSDRDEVRGWMDSTLGEGYEMEVAVGVARLARACIENDPRMRPSATEIVDRLSAIVVAVEDGVDGGGGSVERALLQN